MHRFVVSILAAICSLIPVSAAAAPGVTNIIAPDDAVLYEKYEVGFEVSTTATNLYWPYDASPAANTPQHPNAVPAGVGVSVDGLFLPPGQSNWNNAIVQPGFYYQEFTRSDTYVANATWLYPTGNPFWKLRFAPTVLGQWRYKIRVTDAFGTFTTPEHTFNCTSSTSRGFVRVSPTDSRYFELSDGAYLPLIGVASDISNLKTLEETYAAYHLKGINLIRSWWQSSSPGLPFFGAGGQGGDSAYCNLNYSSAQVMPGKIVSALVPNQSSEFNSLYGQPNIKNGAKYRFSAMVKTVSIAGTGDYGARLRVQGMGVSERLKGNNDWRLLSMDFTNTLNWGYITISIGQQNVTSGTAYCAEISLKEDLGGGQYGPEILVRRRDFQAHMSYPQDIAWKIDAQLEAARQNGIYVKAVIEEKNDTFWGRIKADGTWDGAGVSEYNLYCGAPTSANRVFQTYYWRYVIARWGYSTALHSVEFVNEGDPNHDWHKEAVSSLGGFFRTHDPNKHLVSTSNWHSVSPGTWRQPNVDIADMHMYLGWNSELHASRIWPGWDGSWSVSTWIADTSNIGTGFAWDEQVFHSGVRALKVTVPAGTNIGDGDPIVYSNLKTQIGVRLGDQIHLSMWVKGNNVLPYSYATWNTQAGLALQYSCNGGDFAGYPASGSVIPLGSYNWTHVESTWTVQQSGSSEPNLMDIWPFHRTNGSTTSGAEVWLDDIVVENLTTGQVINYNGGFEYVEPESYDVVAGHCAFSQILHGFAFGKPHIRGETGICYPQRFTNPYKSFGYTGEDQLLVDDLNGVWWKKLVWSHTEPHGLIEIYWWINLLTSRNFTYAKAYQTFVADVPLSNGSYRDIAATVSNPKLRVLGQKDLVHNRAHLWVDNSNHTWKKVVDGAAIPAVSGTVTISGLQDGTYRLESWNTSTGVVQGNSSIECTGGNIVLTISDLATDTAFKIYPGETDPPTGSVIINSDAAGTNSRLVTLTLSAIDSGSGVACMSLSNDMASWTGWQAYSTARDWTLSAGDGTKSVFVQYVDVAGNISPVYEDTILLDSSPPSGAISINSGAAYTGEPGVEITILAMDSASGVAQMRFSNDATTWTVWEAYSTSKSWTLATGQGSRIVYAQFMDGAGNVSRSFTDTILLDSMPPTGQVTINSGDAYTSSISVQLTLSASDPGSGVGEMRFSNDGTNWNSWTGYSTAASWDVTSGAGQKTVYAQFKDHADRVSNSCTDTITLDDSLPTGSIVINSGDAGTNSTSAILTLSATDTGSGISQMRLSNDETTWSAWETYGVTKAWTLTSGDGSKTVYVQFKDVSGNVSSSYSDSIQLSTTMPGSSVIINSGAAFTNSTSASLALTDGGWGATNMRFSNDGTTWSSYESYRTSKTWTLSSGQGTKTVRAQFRDGSGNTSTPCSDAIVLDTAAPSGSVTVDSGAAYANTTSVTLSLSATDSGSGLSQMRFSSNGTTWNAWESYAASKSWTLSTGDGTKTAYVQFKDGAGNSSSSQSDTIVLDTAAPSGSITIDAGAQYATTTSVTVTLSVTDSGSGLSQMRFSNDGTNWSAWETYAATKSWTLTSGDGTKTVHAQLKDRAGNASASPSDTIILATSGPTGTVNINSGAEYTRTTSVALTVSAGGGAGVSQMRFSSDGVSWSSWQTYATARNWTLTSGDGTKTVYAQFKDAAGNVSDNATDTIILKTAAPTVSIMDPTSDAEYRTNHPLLTIGGTASDDVSSLTWSAGAGASGDCAGTTVWSTDEIVFAVGANVITVTAWDAAGNSSTDTVTLDYIDARIPSTWTGLQMVSIPIIPDEPDPKPAVGFDQNAWCIYRPQVNNYIVYANDPSRLTWLDPAYATPGRGFWARFAGEAKTPLGEIPAQDQPVAIHLYRGWNIVGQPFLAPVKWSLTGIHVQEAGMGPRLLRDAWDVVDDYAIGWDQANGTYYVVYDSALYPGAVDTLTPWMAYWVKAYKDCDLILPPP